jgi:aminoglycoside 3-N-acetyltransferase
MSIRQLIPAPLKKTLKSWRSRAVRTFYRFDSEDLVGALSSLGVRQGDTVMVHSSFKRFEGFTGGIAGAIRALQSAVGETGNLLMLTIPFDGVAVEYVRSGHITDISRTPSQMGILTEVFRQLPDVTRSIHPTHPIAVWGKRAAELTGDHCKATTPCGKSSPFEKLLEADGKILLAGTGIRSIAFIQYVEEVLEPEMPFSSFTSEWFDLQTKGPDGQIYQTRTRLFNPAIARRRRHQMIVEPLQRNGFWHETNVEKLNLIVLSAAEVLTTLQGMCREGKCWFADE